LSGRWGVANHCGENEMNVDPNKIQAIAGRLRAAQQSGVPIAPIRDEIADGGVAAAYAVQRANTDHYLKNGKRLVGRKIGLTSKSVQKQLGVDSPDFGMLFDDMALYDGEEVAPNRVLQPKAEAEVALVLERDLTHAGITLADLISAVAYVLPAVEIVGSRIEKWNIKLLDTVADNASSGLFALGAEPRKLDGLDLRLCGMVMERRGEPVSMGAGAACLGHPLNAALWLARTMVEVGSPLRAGDVVMTGALGPMVGVSAGDVLDTRINGIGSVRVAFAS
jgi:2-keto-4-pentenoate hydratase